MAAKKLITLFYRLRRRVMHLFFSQLLPTVVRRGLSKQRYIEEIQLEPSQLMFDKSPIIFSFDDFCFEDGSLGTNDQGGSLNGYANSFFKRWLELAPAAKSTLFMVPDPRHIGHGDFSRFLRKPYFRIDNPLFRPIWEQLIWPNLEANRIEIALHGRHHVRRFPTDYFSAYEFDFINSAKINESLVESKELLESLVSASGFKPPAWSCGQLRGGYQLLMPLKKQAFKYVCLSSPSNGLNYEKLRVSHIYPTLVNGMFNIPQNISILSPIDEIMAEIDAIIAKRGIVNIQMHYCVATPHLRDGWNEENLSKLVLIYRKIVALYAGEIEFLLCKDLVNSCRKKSLSFIQI